MNAEVYNWRYDIRLLVRSTHLVLIDAYVRYTLL